MELSWFLYKTSDGMTMSWDEFEKENKIMDNFSTIFTFSTFSSFSCVWLIVLIKDKRIEEKSVSFLCKERKIFSLVKPITHNFLIYWPFSFVNCFLGGEMSMKNEKIKLLRTKYKVIRFINDWHAIEFVYKKHFDRLFRYM